MKIVSWIEGSVIEGFELLSAVFEGVTFKAMIVEMIECLRVDSLE